MKRTLKINKQGRTQVEYQTCNWNGILTIVALVILFLAVAYCFLNPSKNFERYCSYHQYMHDINCMLSDKY